MARAKNNEYVFKLKKSDYYKLCSALNDTLELLIFLNDKNLKRPKLNAKFFLKEALGLLSTIYSIDILENEVSEAKYCKYLENDALTQVIKSIQELNSITANDEITEWIKDSNIIKLVKVRDKIIKKGIFKWN